MDIKDERVIVYVDGFNFYYGLKDKHWRKYYWLDMVKFFEQFMRDGQRLLFVKYFSARPHDADKSKRQDTFFQANMRNPKFRLVLGKYLRKTITCFNCKNVINTYEEKESDVNLATQIVADAYQDKCDIAIVVSADSDMAPAIELAMEAGKKVFVYFPPAHKSSHLRTIGRSAPILLERYESRFAKSLLPQSVSLANGYTVSIPKEWDI